MSPDQWMIIDRRLTAEMLRTVRRLPRGSGILLLAKLSALERRQLRNVARSRALATVDGVGAAAVRVHNIHELRLALLRRTPMVLLSPIYPTRSHPDWEALPRMRAAAFARLAQRRLYALGGMDKPRFRRLSRLGFVGWAGIDAWLKAA